MGAAIITSRSSHTSQVKKGVKRRVADLRFLAHAQVLLGSFGGLIVIALGPGNFGQPFHRKDVRGLELVFLTQLQLILVPLLRFLYIAFRQSDIPDCMQTTDSQPVMTDVTEDRMALTHLLHSLRILASE